MGDLQNLLNDVTSWPRKLAVGFGYWPFQILKSDLEFRYGSPAALASYFAIIVWLFTVTVINVHHADMFVVYEDASPTETLGFVFTSVLTSICVILLLIDNVVNHGRVTSGWNQVSGVSIASLDFGQKEREQIEQLILGAKHKTRWLTIFVVFMSIAYTIWNSAAVVLGYWAHPRDRDLEIGVFFSGVFVIWCFCSLLHNVVGVIFIAHAHTMQIIFKALTLQATAICERESFKSKEMGFNGGPIGVSTVCIGGASERKIQNLLDQAPNNGCNSKENWDILERILDLGDELDKALAIWNVKLRIQYILVNLVMGVPLIFSIFSLVVMVRRSGFEFENSGSVLSFALNITIYTALCFRGTAMNIEVRGECSLAQNFGLSLGGFLSLNLPVRVVSKVQLISLRFTLKPPTISPGYYYVISNQLTTSLIAVMATYLVVLIQFDSGPGVK
ncbi:unnamed protein product [Allacma fusca]|uniref:Uncharacterized protein n=1 Tax=Allacma fusca TaxID=39272 RepID=A0A8J2M3P0_9HEXA|nr:unnamed protein product [Allacma fusca]